MPQILFNIGSFSVMCRHKGGSELELVAFLCLNEQISIKWLNNSPPPKVNHSSEGLSESLKNVTKDHVKKLQESLAPYSRNKIIRNGR